MLDVAVVDVQGRQQKAGSQRQDHQRHQQERPEHQFPAERHLVKRHHHREQQRGDREVDQPGQDRRGRDQRPREVDLGDQGHVPDQADAGLAKSAGEIGPGQEPRVVEDRVGQTVVWQLGHFAEQQREHDHRHERLQNRPVRPEHRLLVTDLDVAPDEEEEQLAIEPVLVDGAAERTLLRRGISRRDRLLGRFSRGDDGGVLPDGFRRFRSLQRCHPWRLDRVLRGETPT